MPLEGYTLIQSVKDFLLRGANRVGTLKQEAKSGPLKAMIGTNGIG